MVVALIAVALAMVAAGLIAIITGAGMIVLEQGWSSVIAGSVIAAGGAVLAGLALILRELQRLPQLFEAVAPGDEAAVGEVASGVDLSANAASVMAGPVAGAEIIHAMEPAAVAPPAPPDRPDNVPPEPSDPAPAREPDARLAVEVAPKRRPVLEARREPRPQTNADAAPRLVAGPRDRPAPAPRLPAANPAETLRPVFPDFSPRDRIAPRAAEPVAQSEPIDTTPAEDALQSEAKTGADVESGRDEPLSGAAEMMAQAGAPAEAHDVATVVGTYSSGGNVYFMYADGSIQADTPDGVFRFNSLDELKAYIAATGNGLESGKRQASPAS